MSNNDLVVSPAVDSTYELLLKYPLIKEAMEFLKLENEQTLKDQIQLTEIPAPTFSEKVRGIEYRKRLEQLGLKNIQTDEVGNVFGVRPGTGSGPTIVVCSHLDTVFPAGTDVEAKLKDGKVFAPGIADNGRGLAVVLTLLKVLNHFQIETKGDLLFGATVGEEGLGDLNGVKALFETRKDEIDAFISIEPGSPSRITYLATGSRRYSVTYKGRGGHSFADFGLASAIHALGRAVAMISQLETPNDPKTTFTVGTINGGTSVNTIAADANMVIDLRSTCQEELSRLEEKALKIIHLAAEEENARWNSEDIRVEIKQVGDRPAGSQPMDSPIVQAAAVSSRAIGFEPELDAPNSTDSNVPISLGIPAVTLGGGGDFGGIHTLKEYFDPTDAYVGPQQILLTLLGLAGVKNVSDPLIIGKKK
ncbi:M20/M25/M40 family metallo-hydrolase [Anaerobacillus isosaccharinicus]|uniref:M20/M25/M40 family metallo-hydrolase n=1 Tax=Anaerobacillus isosaccharinicus TaxID=1532552 RepID=A0A1S2LSR0_9BACI|nr:M20/M25/M40 family metallo-hydrolase [Anaerobacillus isosaccharinicus]MBA5586335.1 M20/M25/M40 family metallo-hydrolase [Anaerobacillus isosaccharinicus]QOY35416.1 M20/M25/M40 family metallo-hydrolase [Anaerobacillus isosaccharinicus]